MIDERREITTKMNIELKGGKETRRLKTTEPPNHINIGNSP